MGVAGCWGCAQGKQLTEGGRAGAAGAGTNRVLDCLGKLFSSKVLLTPFRLLIFPRIGGDMSCCFLTVTTGLSRFSLLVLSIFAFYGFEAMFAKSFR